VNKINQVEVVSRSNLQSQKWIPKWVYSSWQWRLAGENALPSSLHMQAIWRYIQLRCQRHRLPSRVPGKIQVWRDQQSWSYYHLTDCES